MVQQLCAGGASGNDMVGDPLSVVLSQQGGLGQQGALQALLNPAYAELCGINISKMCSNIPLIEGFIPEIIKQAAETTRKLVVRISWDERGNARKKLELETFIVATPQAEDTK